MPTLYCRMHVLQAYLFVNVDHKTFYVNKTAIMQVCRVWPSVVVCQYLACKE
jgi:hypothetical protein